MSNQVVAVTQRIDSIPGRDEQRDAVDQRLLNWLIQADFIPIPVPNTLCDSADVNIENSLISKWLKKVCPTALLLSGGNDIGEYPTRDFTERFLLSWAKKNRVPVLGICRGLQMMAVWAGAELTQVQGHVNSRHRLMVSSNDNYWPTSVNSYHNWCIKKCPSGFQVVVKVEDGTIEAIRHLDLPWEGWMWHPEREEPFSIQDTERLKNLLNEKF